MERMQATAPAPPETCGETQIRATQVLAFMGTKWTPAVMYHLHHGVQRFGELQRAMAGISPKTLAERLQALEDQKLVIRTVHPDKPPRVEYTLTRRGHELGEILEAIAAWAASDEATPPVIG